MELKRFLGSFAKVFLAVGALSVSAYAGADDYHSNNCAPVCCPPVCCPPANSCCGSPCCEPPLCAWGYNPPAYPRCSCDTNCCNGFLDTVSARFDFLWWRANEDGLELGKEEFVESFANDASTRSTVINRAHCKNPNFKYDPGFRLGLMSYCACDCWDISLNWTHFHTKANASGSSFDGVTFFSDWERLVGVNPTSASSRYTLNLDLLDLEFGRKFYVSSCFVLRPSFGLRGARINQNYRVFSEANSTATTPLAFTDFTSEVKSHSNFLAIGPRVALELEVHVGCGLALFGQAGGSIVFGKFDNHARELYTDFAGVGTPFVQDYSYEAHCSAFRNSRTFTDLAVGLKWDHCFEWCSRLHPVSIAFAWEHHAFYNLNNFNFTERGAQLTTTTAVPNGISSRKHGDLYTQGLTVSTSFGF